MSLWTWAWIAWGLIFAVIEGMALTNSRTGDTLSEHAWAWLGVNSRRVTRAKADGRVRTTTLYAAHQPSGWTRLRRFLMLAFLAWLVAHFLTGGWF